MSAKVLFKVIASVMVLAIAGNGCRDENPENPANLIVGLNDESITTDLNPAGSSGLRGGRIIYSTKSDSALYYYDLGWHQIMDEGRYGQAEVSYRKSLGFDPGFLVCQAVLGRLTLDNEERAGIYENVEAERGHLPPDEESLLGVYHDFVQYTNRRESGDTTALGFVREALANAEDVFRVLVHKYPEEPWLKSEYVEFINSNHGAAAALDSLASLTRERHADNPFLLGFKASLEAERGSFEEALRIAERIKGHTVDKTEPKPWTVLAEVNYEMKEYQAAKQYADRAVELDFRNLDASRLQSKINAAIADTSGVVSPDR